MSIPLLKSRHRYKDIILNNDAPNGERIVNNTTYFVFDELQLLVPFDYKTYLVTVFTEHQEQIDSLEELCIAKNIGFDNRTTIEIRCKQCSEGKAHEQHDHELKKENDTEKQIAFTATNIKIVEEILTI